MTNLRSAGVRRALAVTALATLAAAVLLDSPLTGATASRCVPVGEWVVPNGRGGERVDGAALLRETAKRRVVLLGESHDDAEHHRWQAATLAALHALRPQMVIVLEMFPRRVQGALDRWVAGELTEAEFLRESDWREVWRFDPALYMPIFHFARMHRVPMLAGNVERALTREVSAKGFDAVSPERREGITRPAAPSDAYLDFLLASFGQHENGRPQAGKPPGRDDPAFRRFVESQQVWDRAIAQRIAEALASQPGALVVGILGTGHAMHGFGVPHQLRDLGVTDVAVLLPWDATSDCSRLKPGLADAVFGVAAPARAAAERPRLGVWLETADGGVRIREVEKGSIAEKTGLRDGDLIVAIAGVTAKTPADVAEAVQRQPPGTWLPISVRREAQTVELVAKFPPAR